MRKSFVTGDVLPNGATILSIKGVSERLVLCRYGFSYVTWRLDNEGHTYLGHYHDDLDTAEFDFAKR